MGRNILAGLASSIWSALIGLIAVPFYLKYLGIEAYGLIGFFVTAQGLLQLLDFGLAPTINREVARCSTAGNLKEAQQLLHTLTFVYWSIAGAIALILFVLSPFIARYWLQSQHISQATISHAVTLMGLVMIFRWPTGLYQGVLMGAQRLTIVSAISMAMVTLSSIGAITVLAFISPTIQAFFVWQAIVGLAYVAAVRLAAWRAIGRGSAKFDFNELKRVWRFSAGMSGVAVSAIILMQLDKILLSKLLSLDDFGRYMLASTLAGGLYVLLTPVFNAVYPRMSALVVLSDTDRLKDLYRSGTRLLLSALFPLAITAIIFAKQIILLWTGNAEVASRVAPVLSLFLIGTALNGVMHFPYALQLAYGITRLPLLINAVLMAVSVPITIFLSLWHGATGGAAAWAILNGVYVLLGTWLTHRVLLKGMALRWLAADVAMPLAVASSIIVFSGRAINDLVIPDYAKLALAAFVALVAFMAILALSRNIIARMRSEFGESMPSLFRKPGAIKEEAMR